MSRILAGVQPVREAVRVWGKQVTWVYLQRGATRLSGLESLARSHSVPVRWVDKGELDSLARGTYHQGVLAEAPELELSPVETVLTSSPEMPALVLALDGIVDPQNFGATVRSAVGLAKAPVLWGENASAPLTAAMSRASAGAVEHAKLCRVTSLPNTLTQAMADGFTVVGLDAHAPTSLHEVDLSGPSIIVVGGEGKGLTKQVRRSCTHLATLVLPHTIDSLNASVAAALALYEAARQRQMRGMTFHSNESASLE